MEDIIGRFNDRDFKYGHLSDMLIRYEDKSQIIVIVIKDNLKLFTDLITYFNKNLTTNILKINCGAKSIKILGGTKIIIDIQNLNITDPL